MEITLESLGLTQEELRDRIINKMCEDLLRQQYTVIDEDGTETGFENTKFAKMLHQLVTDRIDSDIAKLFETQITPNIDKYIEGLVLQETNRYGQKTGQPITLLEYLVKSVEKYITEPVNYEGKSQTENGGYSWQGTQTRLAAMIHKHLHYNIENAMKSAFGEPINKMQEAILATAKLKLEELSKSIKISVNMKT